MKKNCSIILVDDDIDDQVIFTSALSAVNETVECECFDNAVNLWQALQTNKQISPACIFLDLNLPFMHGFEFLELIKTSKELNDIPVIIYSTSSRDIDKLKAKELGAYNFISKPNSFSELKQEIDHTLAEVCS